MGAAFMLLETKNVVQFSLLFGSTWLTNAMVFTGILLMVMGAVYFNKKWDGWNLKILYGLLFGLIGLGYFYPQANLLSLDYVPRLFWAMVINFSPVFVANLIFAKLYKVARMAPLAYGANILGAFAGGLVEYSSMVAGYSQLLIWVGLFYALSLVYAHRKVG